MPRTVNPQWRQRRYVNTHSPSCWGSPIVFMSVKQQGPERVGDTMRSGYRLQVEFRSVYCTIVVMGSSRARGDHGKRQELSPSSRLRERLRLHRTRAAPCEVLAGLPPCRRCGSHSASLPAGRCHSRLAQPEAGSPFGVGQSGAEEWLLDIQANQMGAIGTGQSDCHIHNCGPTGGVVPDHEHVLECLHASASSPALRISPDRTNSRPDLSRCGLTPVKANYRGTPDRPQCAPGLGPTAPDQLFQRLQRHRVGWNSGCSASCATSA
jgi:hypothetical protein